MFFCPSQRLLLSFFGVTVVLQKPVFGFLVHPEQAISTTFVTRLHATWSDSKAVRDYQDFLSSGKQEIELASDGPSVIVMPMEGNHILVDGLLSMGMGDDVVLTPEQDLPPEIGGRLEYPIYIAVSAWQLDDFLKNLPDSYKHRCNDFVFFSGGLQYGNIEDVLKNSGYCRDSMTQVLATGLHVTPMKTVQDLSTNLGRDATGEEKIAGDCASCGKWAGAIAERMERSNIKCRTDFYREWRRRMWERSVYDAVFNLVVSYF
jgi:hypothetical protein